jgi:cold shock CspA family protein/arsenate reductase-like glutaredoxin family protein
MIKGTIKFFNKAKGFGFITPDDGSRDVFLPPVTVTTTGAARLKTGQRVTFVSEPDVKGPKAVKLELLDEAPAEVAAPAAKSNVALYYDSASEDADDVLEALKGAGQQPRLIDYAATPPSQDQLKRLAIMLRDVDQSLVRRYDHLFLELQLDDRFISENDFWTAIVEHPVLINGPVVVVGNRARICKTAGELRTFLGMDGEAADRRPKTLSPRMMAMITGGPVPSRPVVVEEVRKAELAPPPAMPAAKVEAKPKAKKAAPRKAAVAVPEKAAAKAKKKAPAAKKPQKAKVAPKKGKK